MLDEFHRASPRLFDALQAGVCRENLVLITSTMHYYRRFVEGIEAPLKGLFSIRRVGLLSPIELLAVDWGFEGKELVERLVFYQEPTLVGRDLKDIILSGREFARSLVGEVIDEEDYVYTRRFDAILEALAAGKNRLSEMANYLYSRGLIEKPSTSYITKYLDIMLRTGLIERIEVWGKKRRSIYRHVSPLTEIVYYLDARYGFYDFLQPWNYVEKITKSYLPILIERFIERFLSEYFGLKPVKVLEPEIDIALVEYKGIHLVAEVKWSNELTKSEVKKIEEKLGKFPDARQILVVPDKTIVPETSLEVWDVEDLKGKASTKIT